ncbi:cell surface glycoprotein CD200 receptor 1-like [Discoglossus pictus]
MKTKKLDMHFLLTIYVGLNVMTYMCVHVVEAGASLSVPAGNTTVLLCPHVPGDSLILATWKVHRLYNPHCTLSFSLEGNQSHNGCSNRMELLLNKNISLRINNSKITDEGNYTCEIVTASGTFPRTTILHVLVQPCVTLKINRDGSPECQALSGNPAAKISWIPESEDPITTNNIKEQDQTWTVISTYTPRNITDVTCVVSHPTFAHPQNRSIALTTTGMNTNINLWVGASIAIIFLAVLISAFIFYWRRKKLRTGVKRTATTQVQDNTEQNKEEVEPYASFTQKVNIIYNTSSELA